jgi:hypothetical protein
VFSSSAITVSGTSTVNCVSVLVGSNTTRGVQGSITTLGVKGSRTSAGLGVISGLSNQLETVDQISLPIPGLNRLLDSVILSKNP